MLETASVIIGHSYHDENQGCLEDTSSANRSYTYKAWVETSIGRKPTKNLIGSENINFLEIVVNFQRFFLHPSLTIKVRRSSIIMSTKKLKVENKNIVGIPYDDRHEGETKI